MSTTVRPRLSIGIPVYNGEKHLATALDSLLAQTFNDFEVVISDNDSKDRTLEICQDYAAQDKRIKILCNETNLGAAPNFNTTFRHSRGLFFKWMAHDDIIAPSYLERCMGAFDSSPPTTVLVFPRRRYISHDGTPIDGEPYLVGRSGSGKFNGISFERLLATCGSRYPIFVFGVMRSESVRRTRLIGSYPSADLVFVAELRLLGEFLEITEPLYFQRLHDDSPEVRARMTKRGDAIWFDSKNQGRRVYPECRLLVEQIRAILDSEGTPQLKAKRFFALPGFLVARALQKLYRIRNWQRKMLWRLWSRVSMAAVRASHLSSIPLRLWAVAAGLRDRDQRAWLKTAVSPPWLSAHPELMRFAAERIAKRDDPEAAQLLAEWARDPSPVHRDAANHVLTKKSIASNSV